MLFRSKFSTNEDGLSANIKLKEIKNAISTLTNDWNKLLLDTISDPLILPQLDFLSSPQKDSIEKYLNVRELPEVVDNHFISSLLSLLEGFEPVVINTIDFIRDLESLGPTDINDFNKKISEIIHNYVIGQDTRKIRVIFRKKEDQNEIN